MKLLVDMDGSQAAQLSPRRLGSQHVTILNCDNVIQPGGVTLLELGVNGKIPR